MSAAGSRLAECQGYIRPPASRACASKVLGLNDLYGMASRGLVQAPTISARVQLFTIRSLQAPAPKCQSANICNASGPGLLQAHEITVPMDWYKNPPKVPECHYLQYFVARVVVQLPHKHPPKVPKCCYLQYSGAPVVVSLDFHQKTLFFKSF